MSGTPTARLTPARKTLTWIVPHGAWLLSVLFAVLAGSEHAFCSAAEARALPMVDGGPFGSAEFFTSQNRAGAEIALFVSVAAVLLALVFTNVGQRVPLRATVANIGFWLVGALLALFAMLSQIDEPAFCSAFSTFVAVSGIVGLAALIIYVNVVIQRTLPEVLETQATSDRQCSNKGASDLVGVGNRAGKNRRATVSPDDFLEETNWRGSYYELAIQLGSPADPAADTRLENAVRAAWSHPDLDGCYVDRRLARRDQPRIDPDNLDIDFTDPIYGLLRLPSGVSVVCVSHVIREQGDEPWDWLDVCLPTGALERTIPNFEYPLHQEGSRRWREPIDSLFVGIAERVASAAPFHAALIGEEASGFPTVDENGEPLAEVQAGTSVLTCSSSKVRWHQPRSW